MGFKTKLNTLFDIAVVWKRKRGNEGGSRLHILQDIPKYSSGGLVDRMTINQMNSTTVKLSSFQDT